MENDKAFQSIFLPYRHISISPGKNLRSKMFSAFNKWFNYQKNDILNEIKESVEILQNASLLIDDIEDGSLIRRGMPCAHLIYGEAATINSANYYYFLVMERIIKITPVDKLRDVMLLYADTMLRLHEGQNLDIYYRDNHIVPNEEEYLRIIRLKTGTFFRCLYSTLKILSDFDLDLDNLCDLVGKYFQIKDDYINLKCDDYSKLKGFAEDITEGKYSFLIVHAINRNLDDPNNSTILNILKMHTQDDSLKKIVIEYLKKAGSFEYTEKYLENLKLEILNEVKKFDDNPLIQEVLAQILLDKK